MQFVVIFAACPPPLKVELHKSRVKTPAPPQKKSWTGLCQCLLRVLQWSASVCAGLSMELFVEQHEYMAMLTDAAGIRLMIHNQSVMPFPEDLGLSIRPGTKTFVGMKRVMNLSILRISSSKRHSEARASSGGVHLAKELNLRMEVCWWNEPFRNLTNRIKIKIAEHSSAFPPIPTAALQYFCG